MTLLYNIEYSYIFEITKLKNQVAYGEADFS